MKAKVCAKCGGEMQEGFILEVTESGRAVSSWVGGKPEFPWTSFGVRIKGKEQLPIQSFRCTKCGFLESYARIENTE
jgi:hypothetical protein